MFKNIKKQGQQLQPLHSRFRHPSTLVETKAVGWNNIISLLVINEGAANAGG